MNWVAYSVNDSWVLVVLLPLFRFAYSLLSILVIDCEFDLFSIFECDEKTFPGICISLKDKE